MTVQTLDLRKVACPINFVRSKIRLDAMVSGEILEIWLDDGEPIESVSKSLVEEGHQILEKIQEENSNWILKIRRA